MTKRVKVIHKYQIAVPTQVRKMLQTKLGAHLLVEVRDGHVLLMPEPADYSRRLRGLQREVWAGVEPQDYVRQVREAWQG